MSEFLGFVAIIGCICIALICCIIGSEARRYNGVYYVLAAIFAFCAISLLIWNLAPSDIIETNETITCLGDSSSLSGSFMLGSGSFKGKTVYDYYIDTEQGALRRTIDADGVYIRQTDGDEAYVHFRQAAYMTGTPFDYLGHKYAQYIVVPKGTIKNTFLIDLE